MHQLECACPLQPHRAVEQFRAVALGPLAALPGRKAPQSSGPLPRSPPMPASLFARCNAEAPHIPGITMGGYTLAYSLAVDTWDNQNIPMHEQLDLDEGDVVTLDVTPPWHDPVSFDYPMDDASFWA